MAEKKSLTSWILLIAVVVAVFFLGILASSILEMKQESVAKLQPVTELRDFEPRNEVWGENYPREYETYMKTLDMNFSSVYGGNAMIDYLEEFPELVILWAGYGFSKDYNQGRGHGYAIEDIRRTLRTGGVETSPMPATCWTCKSPDVPRLMAANGIADFYKGKWIDKGHEVVNPIGCQDCHNPKTMDLTISRPALKEAFERQGKKMDDFTHQEMRSLVCAQCHVEYYFNKKKPVEGVPYLTFPWDDGFTADDMEKYYDNIEFQDWTHKLSRAPMLKAQHPDYELFMTGVHAKRGVSCADCHMPYKVEGGTKFSDHHVQSPLNNIANACQVCHRESEAVLYQDVVERQNKVLEIRRITEKAIAAAHLEAWKAWEIGATEDEMAPILTLIRHAQWRWDWVAAANGVGFHSPVEALRVLGTAIAKAEKARGMLNIVFVKHNIPIPVDLPDFSTKEIAQKLIGLDPQAMAADKAKLLNEVVPEWDKKAKERQGTLIKY